ncbi:hypothetical protein AAFF_G00204330 [Aldrovandia affinis]|uniref:Uncharacterized protein n=1 Tax=Aldrovandia affinis TaxID=143900 RepID=A0AAD7RHP4_9TELE|nr:hypothetical protein AAFF_G00204330 [Aldrovandia affinis]
MASSVLFPDRGWKPRAVYGSLERRLLPFEHMDPFFPVKTLVQSARYMASRACQCASFEVPSSVLVQRREERASKKQKYPAFLH